jgi:hypothetical protein
MDITEAIIDRLFSRTDCYARARMSEGKLIYMPSYYGDASTPLLEVDREVIQHHLQGTRTIGSYVLNEDKCRFAAIDVDVYEGDPKEVGWGVAQELRGALLSLGIPSDSMLIEFSGRKGWHVWILFEELTEASSVRRVLQAAVQEIGFQMQGTSMAEREGFPGHLELFPKSDQASGRFGNLIKLPLGRHPVSGNRSVFYSDEGDLLPDTAIVTAEPMSAAQLAAIAPKAVDKHVESKRRKAHRLVEVPFDKLYDNCEYLQAAKKCADYHSWRNAGIVLAACVGGDEEFHRLCRKSGQYDAAECDRLLQQTRGKGIRCDTIGCSKCEGPTPIDRCFPAAAYRATRIDSDPAPTVNLQQSRAELSSVLDRLLDDPQGLNLVVAPCGLGKTTQLLQRARDRGLRVLTLAPDHGQVPHCLSAYPGVHLKSRGKLDEELDPFWCAHVLEIEKLQQRNFSGTNAFCRSCNKANRCAYLRMLHEARAADHVVAVHAHLDNVDPRILSNRDLIVVDEPIWNWYRREESFSSTDVEECLHAMRSLAGDEFDAAAEALAEHLEELLNLRHRETYSFDGPLGIDKQFRQAWEAHARGVVNHRNVIPDLENASEHGTPVVRGDGFSYVHVSELYQNMVMLDAFGERDFYEQVTGRSVRLWEPTSMPEQRVKVHQVLDGAYPNASIVLRKDGSRRTVLNEIERIGTLHPGVEPAFICTKQFEEILTEHYPDADYLHFGNLVGRDDFRDKPLVIRIGYQMLSYQDLVKNARVLFGLQWNDREVLQELQGERWSPLSYNNGGNGYEVRTKRFDNEYVQMYYDHVVLGEMYQGDGRCRPYEGEGHYYIICNLPTRLRVDQTVILRDLRPDAEQAVAQAVAAIPCGQKFTSSDIHVDYHDRTVRRKLNGMDNVEKCGERGWVRVR